MKRISIVLAQVTLAITFVVAGLVVCVVPNFPTQLMAGWYFDEETSPFTKEEAVTMAVVTKQYTFFGQDRYELYATMAEVNEHAASEGRSGEGALVVADMKESSLEAAVEAADDAYVIPPSAIDHLDDVSLVVKIVFGVGFAMLWIAGTLILTAYYTHSRSGLPRILVGGGICALAIMALCLAWGIIGFDSLFNTLHALLFADGTWTFPADSLLICLFPMEFWRGMGILWVSCTCIFSVVSIIIGKLLAR